MWKSNEHTTGLMQWSAEARTATLAERSVMIGADSETGNIHLTLINEEGKPVTITMPVGASRNIGTALIEASIIASGDIGR